MALAKLRLMNEMELMMMRKDIEDFEVVFALYTITHCADMMLDEIAEDDLPEESLRDQYRSVRSSIYALTKSLEQYRDANIGILNSDCED